MRQLQWIEPVWVSSIGVVLLLLNAASHPSAYTFLLAGLFLFWPVRYWDQFRTAQAPSAWERLLYAPTAVTLPTILLIGAIIVSVLASPQHRQSLAAAGQVLFGIALGTSFIHWPFFRRSPERLGYVLVALGAMLGVLAPFITTWKEQNRIFSSEVYTWLETLSAASPDRIHANILAGGLTLAIPVGVSLWLAARSAERNASVLSMAGQQSFRVVLPLAVSLMVIVLILTQSRGAYLATGWGILILLGVRWPKLWLWLLLPVTAFFTLLLTTSADEIQASILSSDGTLGGWPGRLNIWQNSLGAVYDFPYTGIGIGTFMQTMPRLYPLRVSVVDYPHTHNLYLQVGLDIGLLGLVAFLAILLLLISLLISITFSLRTARIRQRLHTGRSQTKSITGPASRPNALASRQIVWLAGGALGALGALMIHGLVDSVIWTNKLTFMSWLLFAYATAIINRYAQIPCAHLNVNELSSRGGE